MDVKEFIDSIKEEYLFYLYKEYENIFPGCCHEASNLLCGYINYYFDSNFKHKFISGVPKPHSYISNEQGIIIDFTSWQYLDYCYGKLKNETSLALLERAQKCSVFPITDERKVFIGNYVAEEQLEKWVIVRDIECYEIYDIEKYPPHLFMKYCTHKRAVNIQKKLYSNNIF